MYGHGDVSIFRKINIRQSNENGFSAVPRSHLRKVTKRVNSTAFYLARLCRFICG